MQRRSAITVSLVAAVAASAGTALFVSGAAEGAAKKTFRQLPLSQQTLIASRQGITAINRSNAIAGRIGGSTIMDIAAVSMTSFETNPLKRGINGNGVLAGATGSLYAPLALPEGATITGLTLRTRDNDAGLGVTAKIQRRAVGGAYSATAGLTTIAQVSSTGAADPIRSFAVKVTGTAAKITNSQSTVYLELILPDEVSAQLQPLSVQVTYRPAPIKYKKVKLP